MSERRYALLIGNGSYPDEPRLPDLRCPVNDINALGAVLENPKRGQFVQTLVLPDQPAHEINLRIHETLNSARAQDLVVIYFSGHGKQNRAGDLFLAANNTKLDVLAATSVPVTSIRSYIDDSPCSKVILILDCCFSGAAGDAFAKGADVSDQLQIASRSSGTYLITASTSIQAAFEKADDEHSVFTKHMVEGLRSGNADRAGDGVITINELYTYVHDAVAQEGPQVPTKWGLDVRGELVISRSGREPRAERAEKIRALLLELARQDRLPNEILADALRVVDTPAAKLSKTDRNRDAIAGDLQADSINAADFVLRWARIKDEPAAPPPPEPAPPEPAPAQAPPEVSEGNGQSQPAAIPFRSPRAKTRRKERSRATGLAMTIGRRSVALAAGITSVSWAGALAFAMSIVYHPLLFETSYYKVERYLQGGRYRSQPYDGDVATAFASAAACATLILVIALWRLHPRFRVTRSLVMLFSAGGAWGLIGFGAAQAGDDRALVLPFAGFALFAVGMLASLWRPKLILQAGWLFPSLLLFLVAGFFGFALFSGLTPQGIEAASAAAAGMGVLVGVVALLPLLALVKRAARREYQ